ncbi:MAG: LysM peptidoglycan-binding domain-containing protein [Deltaproteobacteria bacterium]|nr:LysM peptidoglycan-binding domain-containing protein [Deltaproteobacteria bacterium]
MKTRLIWIVFLVALAGGCASLSEMLPWKAGKAEEQKLDQTYVKKGQELEQHGDLLEALKQYKLALTVNPENQEAFESRNKLVTKIRMVAERHYKSGLKYRKQGKYGLARRQFLTALKFWPDHIQAKKMVAIRREIRTKEYVLHTIKPGESLSKVAQIYYGDYHHFPIIAEFNKLDDATRIEVGDKIKVPKIDGMLFFEKGQKVVKKTEEAEGTAAPPPPDKETKEAEAIEDETEQDEKEPDDTVVMYTNLGIDLFNKKNYEQAIVELNKVVNADPNNAKALEYLYKSHFQQGMNLFNKQEYLSARKEFEDALKYWSDCEQCITYARRSEETYKEIHYNKAISNFNKEDLSGAVEEWELVKAVDHTYKDVEVNLKKAKALLKRLEQIRESK